MKNPQHVEITKLENGCFSIKVDGEELNFVRKIEVTCEPRELPCVDVKIRLFPDKITLTNIQAELETELLCLYCGEQQFHTVD